MLARRKLGDLDVSAIALGCMPDDFNCACTAGRNDTTMPTTPIAITIHFAAFCVESFALTRYWIDAIKLMKNSRNAVQAEGT